MATTFSIKPFPQKPGEGRSAYIHRAFGATVPTFEDDAFESGMHILRAFIDRVEVGWVEYSVRDGVLNVWFIRVEPSMQQQGIAKAIHAELKKRHPALEIRLGNTISAEGDAFCRSVDPTGEGKRWYSGRGFSL